MSAKLAQALTFIVSVVMTRQDERVINTQNAGKCKGATHD